jgi:hypothetical protein
MPTRGESIRRKPPDMALLARGKDWGSLVRHAGGPHVMIDRLDSCDLIIIK